MIDFEDKTDEYTEEGLTVFDGSAPLPVKIPELNEEALSVINQIITEHDPEKTKELTYLFNANQNKKTMVRVHKLSDLLDTITDQALTRFTQRPDEISNKELFDGLKIVQDLIERGQKQISGAGETPLIQINQQNNEVNLTPASNLSRDSRERVKAAVEGLLAGLAVAPPAQETTTTEHDAIIIDSVEEDTDNG